MVIFNSYVSLPEGSYGWFPRAMGESKPILPSAVIGFTDGLLMAEICREKGTNKNTTMVGLWIIMDLVNG